MRSSTRNFFAHVFECNWSHIQSYVLGRIHFRIHLINYSFLAFAAWFEFGRGQPSCFRRVLGVFIAAITSPSVLRVMSALRVTLSRVACHNTPAVARPCVFPILSSPRRIVGELPFRLWPLRLWWFGRHARLPSALRPCLCEKKLAQPFPRGKLIYRVLIWKKVARVTLKNYNRFQK